MTAPGERIEIRRHIRATPERVFAAWTDPDQLVHWWGPGGTVCTVAEVDLRVGGSFRLGNELPDGRLVWISGDYEAVRPPHELRHTWVVGEPTDEPPSVVTVLFHESDGGTDVVITHTNIATVADRESREAGWRGCLDGLALLVEGAR